MQLWEQAPGHCEETPAIQYYPPAAPAGTGAVVIFPGGGYCGRTAHEGAAYAEFLAAAGVHAFVVDYRVAPHRFPLPQLDARRAVRFVRAHAAAYGIDKQKVAVMGSSAGGHLAASTAVYTQPVPFEDMDAIDRESGVPNAQILCYPVICSPLNPVGHEGSYLNLLGGRDAEKEELLDPARHVTPSTPPAFIWHTADDTIVDVRNSYEYAAALRAVNVPVELHVFPHGPHGMGLATGDLHVHQWTDRLLNWLRLNGWMA